MNYLIVCPPRSGSSYLGEFLQLQGLPYYNELFTPEITRTQYIWPKHLERQHIDNRIDLALGQQGSGFKLPYNDSMPGMWALTRVSRMCHVKIIHIIRDDLVEQFASWLWLNMAGISMARDDGSLWNTDGKRVESCRVDPPYEVEPSKVLDHFRKMEFCRRLCRELFRHNHPYMEIASHEVFEKHGMRSVCKLLNVSFHSTRVPNQIPTPRPMAREMIKNYDEVAEAFQSTSWANQWI